MSTSDTILLFTEEPLPKVVDLLCSRMHLVKGTSDRGTVYLARKRPDDPPLEVGGPITANPYSPEPDVASVIDGYDIAWDVSTIARNEEILRATTRELFMDVVAAFPEWPAAFLLQVDHLLAAYRPEVGLVEFPPGTSPDGEDRELWRPFDVWTDRPEPRSAPETPTAN